MTISKKACAFAWTAFILLSISALSQPFQTAHQTLSKDLTGAVSLYQNAHFDSSILVLEESIPKLDNRSIQGKRNLISSLNLLGKNYIRTFHLQKAKDCFQLALSLNTPFFSHKAYIQSLLGMATLARINYNNPDTRHYTEKALKYIDKHKDPDLYAEALYNLARINFLINSNLAHQYFKYAIEHFPRNSDLPEVYAWYANFLNEEHKTDRAKYYLNEGIQVSTQCFPNDTLRLVECYLMQAFTHIAEQNFISARKMLNTTVLPLVEYKTGNAYRYLKSEAYRFIGWTYRKMGDYTVALQYYEKQLGIKKALLGSSHFKVGEVYHWMGMTYYRMNYPEKTVAYEEKAIPIFEQLKQYEYVIQGYNACGLQMFRTGQFQKALGYFDQSLSFLNKISSASISAFIVPHYKAKTYFKMDSLQLAKKEIHHAIAAAQKRGLIQQKHYRLAEIFSLKAKIHARLQEPDSMRSSLKQAHEIAQANLGRRNPDINKFYNSSVDFYLQRGNLEAAEKYLEIAIRENTIPTGNQEGYIPGSTLNKNEMVASLYYKGLLAEKKYKFSSCDRSYLHDALKAYQAGIRLIKETSTTFVSELDKLYLRSLHDGLYKRALSASYALSPQTDEKLHLENAFAIAEQGKAALLLEQLSENEVIQFSNIPDSIKRQEISLRQQVNYLSTLMKEYERAAKETEQMIMVKNELFEKKRAHDRLLKQLKKTYPKYHSIKYDRNVISLKQAQSKLKSNEAILEYFVGDKHTYVLAIMRNKASFKQLPPIDDAVITKLRSTLNNSQLWKNQQEAYINYTQAAYTLYSTQVAPIINTLADIDKIYIIPDGQLHYIPFEALITQKPETGIYNYKKLAYLFKEYTISYAYSATTLFAKRNTIPINNNQVLGLAPTYSQNQGNLNSHHTDTNSYHNDFAPLAWNDTELKDISRIFEGRFLYQEKATEAAFHENTDEYGILHFATHAYTNNEKPMHSLLAFAPALDSLNDGYLHAFELYNMKLKAKMAVLSACDTGNGKLYSGEGPMSLAHAFAYAGCHSVVMTHWQAEDEATSQIMQYFYTFLSKGMHKDVALQKAKLQYLNTAPIEKLNPTFWNNFVVMGDVSPIVKNNTWLIILIGTSILLSLVFLSIPWIKKCNTKS